MADHIALHQTASSQVGYFTLEQARKAGFTDQLLGYHCKTGRFTRETEGVYRLRDYPEGYSDIAVAWLSLQRRTGAAVVSHETALSLLKLCDLVPRAIDITIERPRGSQRRADAGDLKNVRVHTTSQMPMRGEIAFRSGVAVTGVKRTLVDCVMWGTDSSMMRQAIKNAIEQRLVSVEGLREEATGREKVGARGMLERALEDAGVEVGVGELAI